jgi:DNA invertase Pin-like site-specific DNA recombinase
LLKLLDAGYEFISATETIENTPTGRLLFRMLSSFAVYESEKLSNRQSIAKIHNLILQKFDSL